MAEKSDAYMIANELSIAVHTMTGLVELIREADEIGRLGFPSNIAAGIEALHTIGLQAREVARSL